MDTYKLLQRSKEYKFEEKNTFKNGPYSCFFTEKEFGFVVFFIVDDNMDYAVYDNKKNLTTLIPLINLSISKDDWMHKFLYENACESESYIDYIIKRNKVQ